MLLKNAPKFLTVIFFLTLISLPQASHSFGLGIYVPFGTGSGTFTYADDEYDTEYDFDTKYGGGFGIVLDTKIARDGLFNYRLNLGFINGTNTFEDYNMDIILSRDDYKYYVMDHTFGFGVLRNSWMRLWLGPQIRLAIMNMEEEKETGYDYYTQSISGIGFGLAPVIGANFNFGPVFTAAIEIGYRVNSYAGTWEFDGYTSSSGSLYLSEDFTTSENMVFINFSLLFRIGDVFESAYDDADDDKPDYDEEYY